MNMMNMMKKAQKMQSELQNLQKQLEIKHYEAEAGGGAVQAIASGDGMLVRLKIQPEVIKETFESEDPEMLEDLVLTAANEAIQKGKKEIQEEMQKLTSGLGLPPGMLGG